MLRLHDPRTGRLEGLPRGEVLRVHLLDGADLRALVVADLLRRVAERGRRTVLLSGAAHENASDYGVAPLYPEVPSDADVYVSPRAHEANALTLVVPPVSGSSDADPLAVRLAFLAVPYREPLVLNADAAASRLAGWRADVAGWANAPGRPLHRPSVTEAETALADDLDAPTALDVLDRVAADEAIPPGSKLETFVHLDLLLGLNVVADIGRTA
ncbi:hypothetical protein [Actinomadura harenae]|uniref:Uncharacterized protein n=1 Tax=Actinomadura harenae TaxID=2483351 RepID=A0A3M2LTD6_9ACTN|nr:hypothetical protein [Actinomadura harenae]RMI40120.1 hypothetical protein EBO15_27550 [Actinomadura harenae]